MGKPLENKLYTTSKCFVIISTALSYWLVYIPATRIKMIPQSQ